MLNDCSACMFVHTQSLYMACMLERAWFVYSDHVGFGLQIAPPAPGGIGSGH